MATDFFTLIGLVLAVSGSTYAAIAGIHAWLSEGVKSKHDRSKYCHNFINEKGTDETKKNSTRDHDHACRCMRNWKIASVVPTILFLAFSFGAASHVYVRYLLTPAATAASAAPAATSTAGPLPPISPIYMHALGLLTVADIICIAVTFLSYGGLRKAVERLESGFRQSDQIAGVIDNKLSVVSDQSGDQHNTATGA
jgi:hypothetical protein